MAGQRRTFRREGEAQRRDDLIAATLDCMAENGPTGTTVRAIAERAGVTPGLIRHYFSTKEDLMSVAYASLMAGMTRDSVRVLAGPAGTALQRLASFVAAAVSPPVADPRAMALWAGFIHSVLKDDQMRAVHNDGYLGFRDQLQDLITVALREAGQEWDAACLRRFAIACNAVIDGLWLEGSALPEAFGAGELADIALVSVGRILRLQLPGGKDDNA